MKNNIFLVLLILTFLMGCSREKKVIIKIYNKETNQTISVITDKSIRYITEGDFDDVPKTEYVKLDISSINFKQDYFFGCFQVKDSQIQLINPGSIVKENRMNDKKKFLISGRSVYERSDVLGFHNSPNCFEFSTMDLKIRHGGENVTLKKEIK